MSGYLDIGNPDVEDNKIVVLVDIKGWREHDEVHGPASAGSRNQRRSPAFSLVPRPRH